VGVVHLEGEGSALDCSAIGEEEEEELGGETRGR